MKLTPHILVHLPYFAEVGRTLSFTKAANAMNLTQAAISYQIKQLEEKIDTVLVVRQPGSQLKLTAAGDMLIREYNYCAKRLNLSMEKLNSKENQGTMRISTPVDFGSLIMPKVIAALKVITPKLSVELETNDTKTDLTQSKWDMAIRSNWNDSIGNNALEFADKKPLYTAGICLVASPCYIQNNGKIEIINELLKHTALTRDNTDNRSWQTLLKKKNIKLQEINNTINLSNTFALKEFAKQGLGIAILPKFSVLDELQRGELVPLLSKQTQSLKTDFFIISIKAPQLVAYEILLRDVFYNLQQNNKI